MKSKAKRKTAKERRAQPIHVTRSDLAVMLFEKQRSLRPWQAKYIVDSLFTGFTETLKSGGHVEIRGFGSFGVKNYKGYTGINPKTGQKMQVKPKKMAFFKPGKEVKDKLNGQGAIKIHRSHSKGDNQ